MFSPLLRAVRAIFVDELRIQRDELGLRLTLQHRPKVAGAKKPPVPVSQAQVKAGAELACIQRDLKALFESIPGSRRALSHLAYVEQGLAEHGLAQLDRMALNLLRHALVELENAVVNWSPAGLASLRSKMAVVLRMREATSHGEEIDVPLSRANLPTPDVIESRAETTDADLEQAALLAAYGQTSPAVEKV